MFSTESFCTYDFSGFKIGTICRYIEPGFEHMSPVTGVFRGVKLYKNPKDDM